MNINSYLPDPRLVVERLRCLGVVVVLDEPGPEPLDVGCDARDAVDPVRHAVLLHEARATHNHVRNCVEKCNILEQF